MQEQESPYILFKKEDFIPLVGFYYSLARVKAEEKTTNQLPRLTKSQAVSLTVYSLYQCITTTATAIAVVKGLELLAG